MRNRDDDKNNNIGSIFRGLDKFINLIADMIEDNKNEVDIKGTINDSESNKNIMGKYGVNIKLGGEKFSELMKNNKLNTLKNNTSFGSVMPKAIEPVTDIFDEEDKLIIVMELPMVKEEDIIMEFDDNIMSINASNKENHYSKSIKLSFAPTPNSIKAKLNNSIYSVVISKEG